MPAPHIAVIVHTINHLFSILEIIFTDDELVRVRKYGISEIETYAI